MLQPIKKVIIWGYPLNSHTHSFIHYAWHKTFKYMGYETYWFDDTNFKNADEFDYTNCLFITEGYCDKNIPLDKSNVYMVHVGINPGKYIKCGARFIDIRYHVSSIYDCNYSYNLDDKITKGKAVHISENSLYEHKASVNDLNAKFRKDSEGEYEAIYIYWATDLLPYEINLDDRFIKPVEPYVTHFIGSLSNSNVNEIHKLKIGCNELNIQFNNINPWKTPVSFEKAKELVQSSVICPDIRGSGDRQNMSLGETGTCHKSIGYVPCRLFKNISYGKLGAINSKRVKELFGDSVIYDEDETVLAKLCFEKRNDVDYIKKQMEWVRDNHTFVNRVNDIIKIL